MKCAISLKVLNEKKSDEAFEKWWVKEQGNRMYGSKYIGKKAWKAAINWALKGHSYAE